MTTGLPDGPQYMLTDPLVLNCKMNKLLKVAAYFVVPAWEGDPLGDPGKVLYLRHLGHRFRQLTVDQPNATMRLAEANRSELCL